MRERERFHLILIKPSHYDDDGYVIQWALSWIPSNSLATLYGLASDCAARRVLGPQVDIEIAAYDETNTRVRPERIARAIRADRAKALVGLVGVQSNQFPRALDLARRFRAQGLPVCIGGFHVSGCIAMLPEMPPDLREAVDLGVTLFAGEAEGRLDTLLRAAYEGTLEPVYDHMGELPALPGTPVPHLPARYLRRVAGARTSFDAGRGCPYLCSFCTIINVQGRRSRHRSPDDVERIVRENAAQGVTSFFITDDNFARNAVWEPLLDRLIHLREVQGLTIKLIIQVDTMCHRIPGFIEKAGRAGVKRVFIGLENINPDALSAARKGQNRITEYRTMLQAWHAIGATTYAGYILGFPGDTPESVARDLAIIQRELPVDLLEFFILTPLPGSADHRRLWEQGVPMSDDMNEYDTAHVTTDHPVMSRAEWRGVYEDAWERYYSRPHIETLVRRAKVRGVSGLRITVKLLLFSACAKLERLHPLEGGFLRRRYRRDRRPGRAFEPAPWFHLRWAAEQAWKYARLLAMATRYLTIWAKVALDRREYRDTTTDAVQPAELDELDLFQVTAGGRRSVARARRRRSAA